jgi:hypothetical protein
MKPWQRTFLLILLGFAGTIGLLVGGFLLFFGNFLPFGDEWDCSKGEAPADRIVGGGRACFVEGSELPAGWLWDPDGNQPLDGQ